MFALKRAVEAAEDMPEDLRANLLGLVEDIEKGDLVEKLGEDLARGFVRGALKQLREELQKRS